MKLVQSLKCLGAAGVLLSGLSISTFAQDQADRLKNETTLTGCLNKDSAGGFTLTDEKTGAKTTVTGSADLEKHAANHKVTLTGTAKEEGGKSVFTVSKIQHVSPSCKAPGE